MRVGPVEGGGEGSRRFAQPALVQRGFITVPPHSLPSLEVSAFKHVLIALG